MVARGVKNAVLAPPLTSMKMSVREKREAAAVACDAAAAGGQEGAEEEAGCTPLCWQRQRRISSQTYACAVLWLVLSCIACAFHRAICRGVGAGGQRRFRSR